MATAMVCVTGPLVADVAFDEPEAEANVVLEVTVCAETAVAMAVKTARASMLTPKPDKDR